MEDELDKMIVDPEIKMLSGEELLEKRDEKLFSKIVVTKKSIPDGSEEEKRKLQALSDELLNHLSRPRLSRVSNRSVGEWDAEQSAVKVVRKDGKFNAFGYSKYGKTYLEYYEAMFLLESNRLEIYYSSMMLSVEQAYLLLLGEERSKKYEITYVYSVLSQNGYIVLAHTNSVNVTYETCVWEILSNSLNPSHEIPEEVRNFEEFQAISGSMERIRNHFRKDDEALDDGKPEKTKNHEQFFKNFEEFQAIADSMENTKNCFRKDDTPDETKPNENLGCHQKKSPIFKRKSNHIEDIPSKQPKPINDQYKNQSLINVLQKEPDYIKFKGIFDKFEIIKLNSADYSKDNVSCSKDLEIDFDIYFNSNRFKKSNPGTPCLRLTIIRYDEPFPSHNKIVKSCQKLKTNVPIVVCMVTAAKQLQAFVYYFA